MNKSSKTRVADIASAPERTFYNDINFEYLNDLNKRYRGENETSHIEKNSQDIVEKINNAVS